MTDEDALLAAIADDPIDLSRWLVLADWLDDQDRSGEAEFMRLHASLREAEPGTDTRTLRVAEERMRELIAAGVRPCVPRMVNSIGMTFVLVPPGRFIMGSPINEPGRSEDEVQHLVTITRPFWLCATAVTQAEYRRVRRANPSRFKDVAGEDTAAFPVDSVTWNDAVRFCEVLSERVAERKAGRVYRLPTEAEWESAARAGVPFPQRYHFGPGVGASLANFNCNEPNPPGFAESVEPLRRTCRVGSYLPNAWGLLDLHGNTGEWCADTRGPYPLDQPVDPVATSGTSRVLRGGLWSLGGKYCRLASRDSLTVTGRNAGVSFRPACVVTTPADSLH